MIVEPNEHQHQCAVVQWAALVGVRRYPSLKTLYAIPNGGKRSARVGARLKLEGVKDGMPDLHLPVARGGFNSLYIEMKAKGGRVKPNQADRHAALDKEDNLVVVCWGADAAIKQLIDYLNMKDDNA